MAEHPVQAFEEDLTTLDNKIAQMGGLAEQALGQAVDALYRRDPDLAEKTLANDRSIDLLERSIEESAITLIAGRQPVAGDLRQIVTAMRISIDLERIGDLAKNIAKRAIAVSTEQPPKQAMQGFMHIAEITLRQLKDVLDAYSQRDADKALKVWRQDNEIDEVYSSLYRELLATMTEEPRSVGLHTHLLFGAKNLERIGDHATNIAETTYFLIKGAALADERPRADRTSLTLFASPPDKREVVKF